MIRLQKDVLKANVLADCSFADDCINIAWTLGSTMIEESENRYKHVETDLEA